MTPVCMLCRLISVCVLSVFHYYYYLFIGYMLCLYVMCVFVQSVFPWNDHSLWHF